MLQAGVRLTSIPCDSATQVFQCKETNIFPTCSGKGETISCYMLHPCWICKKLWDCIKGRQRKAVFVKLRVNAAGSAYAEGLNGKCLTHILTRIMLQVEEARTCISEVDRIVKDLEES